MLSGSLTFQRGTRRKRVPVFKAVSLAALGAFADHVNAYSTGGIVRYSVTEVADMDVKQDTADGFEGYYAVFRFRKVTPDEGENPRREFHLADPKASLFDSNEHGYCIKQTVGETFAAWYSTLTGATYIFEKGWLWDG